MFLGPRRQSAHHENFAIGVEIEPELVDALVAVPFVWVVPEWVGIVAGRQAMNAV
jgi:hypothetical protein